MELLVTFVFLLHVLQCLGEPTKCENCFTEMCGEGYWTEVSDRSSKNIRLEYDMKGCKLGRVNSTQATQCLAGRHIVLVGDSVVRLQYLSLIFLLQYGIYPHGDGSNTLRFPNVAKEHSFRSWEEIYGSKLAFH